MTSPLPVRITRRAAGEIKKASSWWDANRSKAPRAFKEDLQRAFDQLARQPLIGSPATNEKLPAVRRLHLSRIRYYLYYRVREDLPTIEILALWHTSRGSGPDL